MPALARDHIQGLVADREIDLPIGADGQAVHVVAAVAHVNAVAVAERSHVVGGARPSLVAQPPEIGRDGGVHVPLKPQHAGENIRLVLVEALEEDVGLVGDSVAGCILQPVDRLHLSAGLLAPGGIAVAGPAQLVFEA